MKLSDREIEAISNISRNRRFRNLDLWVAPACILVAVVISSYTSYDMAPVIAMLGGFLCGQAAAHSSRRAEDKLIDLVQRYVNSDPEAIRQFAMHARSADNAV